jgi:hypothetical protein
MVNRANNAYRFCVALLLIAGIFFLPGGCSDSNNDNDGGDPGNGGGGGISQAVDPNDPLSSVVQIILTNNFGTGSSSIPDYIKALVRARATGVGALNGEFPLTNATSDSVRTIPGISQSVLVRWLDPLSASDDGSTPRFGANNDFIAYFGDGWDSDWEGDAVGSSPNLNGQVDERKVKRAAPGEKRILHF